MKAIILAGGLGTRMREETEFRPKPMVEIGGMPVLWHIMKNLSVHGIKDFIVATGYKSEMIKRFFLGYAASRSDFTVDLGSQDTLMLHQIHEEADWRVTVADTGLNTMTGGRIFRASRYLDGETFLVTYGDGLGNVDITKLIRLHQDKGLLATVTAYQPLSRFGELEIDQDSVVTQFSEKPKTQGWVNIGFLVMSRRALEYFDDGCVLETGPLVNLAKDGQLAAFKHDGFWEPMDTFREARQLNDLWDSGNAPWRNW